MINYYKYLSCDPDFEAMGLTVLNAGCTRILPQTHYPQDNHPSHHNFNWINGRILEEYQMIYITRGEGIFESEKCGTKKISAGTVMLIYPGERHRYKPNENTGWDEYWVGFRGSIADQLRNTGRLETRNASLNVGFNEKLLSLFLEIIEETQQEDIYYQTLLSGAVHHLLSYVETMMRHSCIQQNKDENEWIQKAKLVLMTRILENITVEQIADEFEMSYSKFRKIFKQYTGIAPGQYQLQLKIQKAKDLLLNPAKSIKEVAYELNFESNFYFSKLFKEKTGLTPMEYRKKII